MGRHALVGSQDNAAAIDNNDLRHRLPGPYGSGAGIAEIEQFAGQGQLDFVFLGHRLGIIEHGKDFGARIHAMNDLGLDWQEVPDVLANLGGFVVEHFSQHRLAAGDIGQTKMAAAGLLGRRAHSRNEQMYSQMPVVTSMSKPDFAGTSNTWPTAYCSRPMHRPA